MSINNRGVGQLDLSLLETSAEGFKFSRRNIEGFLNNLKVVAESLKIRSSQLNDSDMAFESVHNLKTSSHCELNNENAVDIESLDFYEKSSDYDDNKNITPQRCTHKNNYSNIYDTPKISENISSPRPPVSPRSVKESVITKEINVFLKSPRKKQDEFDEATVVRQFAQISSNTSIEPREKKNFSSKISSCSSNMSLENKENDIIPSFYFPAGCPSKIFDEKKVLSDVEKVFKMFPGKIIEAKNFDQVCLALKKPTTWSRILINGCLGKIASDNTVVSYDEFATYWLKLSSKCFDDASIFIKLLVDCNSSGSNNNPTRNYIIPEDFKPLLNHVIFTIHDLEVLKNAPSFHSAYVETVITRIFWRISRTWIDKITVQELRRSNFLDIFASLDVIDNINDERYFFSYIHFYVIYCKFWELDDDHDMMITSNDLKKYSDGALPSCVIDRIIKTTEYSRKTSKDVKKSGTLDYSEFTRFLLADENKRHFKALEYWFRILDIDGDGRLSLEELEYFHEKIMNSIKYRFVDCKSMEDTICHVFDMVSPASNYYITLNDIKRSKIGHKFFNVFTNINKFMEQEIIDGEAPQYCDDTEADIAEWDNFCNKQYELITEDVDDSLNCGDDVESFNLLDLDSDISANDD